MAILKNLNCNFTKLYIICYVKGNNIKVSVDVYCILYRYLEKYDRKDFFIIIVHFSGVNLFRSVSQTKFLIKNILIECQKFYDIAMSFYFFNRTLYKLYLPKIS